MSRVQRLDLRRVPAPELTAHLQRLGEEEDFRLDAEAAAGVVAAGDGSVRDTLSVLEQVLAFASDADARDADGILHVSGEHVTRVLGATPFELTAGVVDAIADADVAAALTRVQELLDRGTDLRRFSLDLARHLRDLLVLAAAPDAQGLVDATAERRERLAQQAQRFGTDSLVRAVELVGEVLVEQRQGPPRLPLELAVARLATPGADGDVLALADRVARLEKSLDGGARPSGPPVDAAPSDEGEGAAGQADTPAEDATPADDTAPDATPADDTEPDDTEPDDTEPADVEPGGREEAAVPTGRGGVDPDASSAGGASDAGAAEREEAASDPAADDEAEEDDPRQLADRAARLADSSGPRNDPDPLEGRPGTASVEREVPEPAPGGTDDLDRISAAWDAIIENVGERSRRAKAFYEPATPVRLNNGVLLLSYPSDKRFHAEQAKSGEMTGHLAQCVEQSTGLERIRVDVQLEDGGTRRPTPPPAAGGSDDAPSPAEVAAVHEVEQSADPVEVDAEEVEQLLRTELGAERLESDEV